jgi:ABC-type polysaccharide/polyol phosphate export permease
MQAFDPKQVALPASRDVPLRAPQRDSDRTTHVLRDLLFVLTWRDIKIKYKQSAMGLLWAILMPAIIIGAGVLMRMVMSKMSGTPLEPDSVASLAVKSLPWAFFVSAIRFATSSLTANANLVTKINCPRIAFPIAAVLSSLFDMAIAILPLIAVLAWCGITPTYALV